MSRQPGATPVGTPGDAMLVLGDSIAAGIGASDPVRRGVAPVFHGLLERHLGRPVELVNLARPGETTTSFIEEGQFDEARRLIDDASGAGISIGPILVSLGANDLLEAGDDRDAIEAAIAHVSANLSQVLPAFRDALTGSSRSELLMLTYYDPSGSDPNRPGANAWWIARLNEVIAQEAGAVGGLAPDLAPRFRGREDELTWYPADVHPTNAGHTEIAHTLWAASGYDEVPPTVVLIRPTAGPLPRPRPTIVAAAEDAVGVERVVAVVDGDQIGELDYHEEAGAYLLLWEAGDLPPGDHRLEVRAVDAAGNVGAAATTVRPTIEAKGTPGAIAPGTPPAGAAG